MRTFDYSVLLNKVWDNEILNLVARIHECKGRQELFIRQKPVELDRLTEIAKINLIMINMSSFPFFNKPLILMKLFRLLLLYIFMLLPADPVSIFSILCSGLCYYSLFFQFLPHLF